MSKVILELQQVAKQLGGVKALRGVSFAVQEGTITGLIGPNGAGKTTTLNCISGLLKPDSGRVLLQGKDITGLPAHKIARLGIGRMLQDPRVFKEMRVVENVLVAFPEQAGENALLALIGRGRFREQESRLKKEASELLELVGLGGRERDLAGDLSYGQQRLLSLARCLAMRTPLLLLDEPTVGVNPQIIARIQEVLLEIVRTTGRTIVLVEHNMDVVMSLSDQVVVLLGEVIASGSPDEIQRDERVMEVYLGTSLADRKAPVDGANGVSTVSMRGNGAAQD